jgi:hypothetical protein
MLLEEDVRKNIFYRAVLGSNELSSAIVHDILKEGKGEIYSRMNGDREFNKRTKMAIESTLYKGLRLSLNANPNRYVLAEIIKHGVPIDYKTVERIIYTVSGVHTDPGMLMKKIYKNRANGTDELVKVLRK